MSKGEDTFAFQCKAMGLPTPEREFKFHPERKWRFDFAWPDKKIAVEVEGGIWSGGRHTRGAGFGKDCEKYNNAVLARWFVLRFPTDQVESGEAIETLQLLLR